MAYLQGNLITNISDAEAASPTMGFGFGKNAGNKSQPKNRKPSRRSLSLTTEDLRDDAKLLDWYNAATNGKNPIVKKSEANRLNVFAAAERALEFGDNPPALFISIVKQHAWHLITQPQEDRAWQRLRRLRNPESNRRKKRDDDEVSEPVSVGDIVRSIFKATCSETASCR